MNTPTHLDVYTIVTNRIIAQLEQSIVPWRKPWTEAGHPQNFLTRIPYRGINVWMLTSLGYAQNYFITYHQLKSVGGSVKKGEKGHVVVYYQKRDQSGEEKSKAVLRYYIVFNIAQCDHLPEVLTIPFENHGISQISACDEIIERMPNCPVIKHSKQEAYYNPVKDYINLPKQGTFASPESYYCAAFHELIHSTGHQSRLNRKEIVTPN